MKTLSRAAILLALFPLAATAAPVAPDPVAPVHQFLDGFNAGDTKTAYAAFVTGTIAITDEFPPYNWVSPKAPQIWAGDYDKNAAAVGVSDGHVSYGAAAVVNVKGPNAYVTLPTVYTYKSHGKPTSEEATMAYALTLTKAGWKIRAWTWSGTVPHPAK